MKNKITWLGAVGVLALVCAAPLTGADAQTATTTVQTSTQTQAGADMRKLIGRNIQNPQNETIGEINSVHVGSDGKVDLVIAGVGGFLNVGEREVALKWSDLQVTNNGEKVVANMTKDQLKALPEYKYPNVQYRGQVFTDSGVSPARTSGSAGTATSGPAGSTTTTTSGASGTSTPTTASGSSAATTIPGTTSDFNTKGDMAGSAIVGATIKNPQGETVGTIDEVYVDATGNVRSAVVAVGGVLGVGAHHVEVPWRDLKVTRDQDKLVIQMAATRESLKAMPEYKYQRRAVR